MSNISKKGKNVKGIITWSIFTRWFFNRTLSIYTIEGGQKDVFLLEAITFLKKLPVLSVEVLICGSGVPFKILLFEIPPESSFKKAEIVHLNSDKQLNLE